MKRRGGIFGGPVKNEITDLHPSTPFGHESRLGGGMWVRSPYVDHSAQMAAEHGTTRDESTLVDPMSSLMHDGRAGEQTKTGVQDCGSSGERAGERVVF